LKKYKLRTGKVELINLNKAVSQCILATEDMTLGEHICTEQDYFVNLNPLFW